MYYAMDTLTLRISDALRQQLDELSKHQNRSASEIVRDSLRQYIAKEKFQTLRKKTLPLAEAQGLLTDEDVFRAIS